MRYLTKELKRFQSEEKKMGFIAGPRQVGKTTLAKFLLKEAGCEKAYFNWDIETHRKAILKSPENFWQSVAAGNFKPVILLDEIHKYPRWKRFLKGLYDAVGEETRILVTGSGRLDVYQKGGDSLFGRYNLYHLHPFSVGELLANDHDSISEPKETFEKHIFNNVLPVGAKSALESIEKLSGFPEPLFSGSEGKFRRWRRSRHHLVLREDLRDLTRVREIGLIEALVALLPERVGSPLSLNALREILGVAFGTVRDYVQILGRLYYLFEVRPYSGKLSRTLRRETKIYLFEGSEIYNKAAMFENILALHLYKACDVWNDCGFGDFALHYVRDKEKREVDFLITEGRNPYVLVEAKMSDTNVAPALAYFKERLKPAHTFQVIHDVPENYLSKTSSGEYLIAAPRFLAFLP